MLNESFELNVSMESAGVSRASRHRHYKKCKKMRGFLVLIGVDGTACDIEPIVAERMPSFMKYGASNNFSFPAFNINPLLYAQSEKANEILNNLKLLAKRQPIDNTALLSHVHLLWHECASAWEHDEKVRISRCLVSAGLTEQLGQAVDRLPPDLAAFGELVRRSASVNVDVLQESLKHLIINELPNRPGVGDAWMDILVVPAKTIKEVQKVPVVLELADRSSFPYPANHSIIFSWINETLMERSGAAERSSFRLERMHLVGH